MKWNQFLIGFFGVLFTISSYGQSNILNAKTPDQIGQVSNAESMWKERPNHYNMAMWRTVIFYGPKMYGKLSILTKE
jgi:hypothetical protein